ncbi:MAG TPA: hypothetical protein VGM54_22340 [Chthoniobacter sp.]
MSQDYLDHILWDDQTELCDSALALSARSAPEFLYEIIEDKKASWVSRTVALSALFRQIELGFRSADEVANYCRALVAKRKDLCDKAFFWCDVVNLAARLALLDLRPTFLSMVSEGFFTDESGAEYLSAEEIDSEYASPHVDGNAPTLTTATQLLHRSYDSFHRSVREFLGCLKPPACQDPETEVENASPDREG